MNTGVSVTFLYPAWCKQAKTHVKRYMTDSLNVSTGVGRSGLDPAGNTGAAFDGCIAFISPEGSTELQTDQKEKTLQAGPGHL